MNDHDFWLSVESFFIDLLHIGWICCTLAPPFPLTWSWVHVLAIANNAVYDRRISVDALNISISVDADSVCLLKLHLGN